jgi:hypothetical protein
LQQKRRIAVINKKSYLFRVILNPSAFFYRNVLSGVKRGRWKQSKARNLPDRYRKFEGEILSFHYFFHAPSNNQAERENRIIRLQQKISGAFRSEYGGASFCGLREYLLKVKMDKRPIPASLISAFGGNPFTLPGAHRIS